MTSALESRLRDFGRGRYSGYPTPLDFFRAHAEYGDLTRCELSLQDSGLYRTLLRYGQLEKAIPDRFQGGGRPPLPEKQVNRIIQSYKRFKRNAKRTSKFLGLAPSTIIKYLRKKGLKIKKRNCALTQEEIDRIVKVYTKTVIVNRTASVTGHCWDTVSKYLVARGIRTK